MRLRDKVLYMLVGGFLVFLGQLLPSALNANNASKVEFDSVVCRTLRVTDNILVSPANDTDNRGVKDWRQPWFRGSELWDNRTTQSLYQ